MTNFQSTTPVIGSLKDLEFRLGVKREALLEIIESRKALYSPFDLHNKPHPYPGRRRKEKFASELKKLRRIDNPTKQLKDIQNKILRRILATVELPPYMFGAVSGKTLVMHAQLHINNQTNSLVRMDISSFYPSIKSEQIYRIWNKILCCPPRIAKILTELTTFDWHLPQGAPTSGALANIFLASIYGPICTASAQSDVTISTWVDDLIFSGKNARELMEKVRSVLAENGLRLAPRKREIFGPKEEKKVTGVRLGRNGTRATHRVMSEIRAAIHRLAVAAVPDHESERYMRNLRGRILHIRSICERDAATLLRFAERKGVRLDI